MARSLLALAVAVLAVTAGCTGVGPQSATTESPTATSTNGTTAAPATDATQPAPTVAVPGFDGDTLVAPLALADAHAQRLSGESFVRQDERVTRDGDNETFAATTLSYGNESRWFTSQDFDGEPFLAVTNGSVEQYVDGDRLYFRLERASGNISYGTHVTPSGESATETTLTAQPYARDYVYAVFTTASWTTVVGQTDTDDTTVYRVLGNASGETRFQGETVSDFSVAANVTDDGFLQRLDVAYERNGTAVSRTVSFSGVGETTVERPDWYDTAVNRTDPDWTDE